MSSYSHIVFDFGNVLFDLDIDGCYSRIEQLLTIPIGKEVYNKSLRIVFEKYERGEISDETLIWNFQQFNPSLDPRLFVEAWNSMLVGMQPDVFDMLTDLRKEYTVSLLSNINAFHARFIHRYLEKEYGVSDFLQTYFDNYFYSHEIGMRKPEQRCYNHVMCSIKATLASDILFIDDNLENVNAAKALGWNAKYHNPQYHITKVITNYLS